jgi:hypothetical protein
MIFEIDQFDDQKEGTSLTLNRVSYFVLKLMLTEANLE